MQISPYRAARGPFDSRLDILVWGLTAILLAFFLGSVIFGAYLNFTPVPTGDGWLGMVGFYLDLEKSPLAWWTQNHEHRIFFSKLLFWLDMRYFSGSGLLLIPVNVVLLLLTWWMLGVYAKKLIGFSSLRARVMILGALGMLCLAWMQRQNIIFSFQSMFILAFLLPLASFYCFARALESHGPALRWRVLALFFGVATTQCMANGVFVLPLLALLSWFGERSPRWFFATLLCAALSLAVFLIGYHKSPSGQWGIVLLQTQPWSVIKFALAYLGGPFYIIFQRIEVAVVAGGFSVALAIYLFLSRSMLQPKPYALALMAYIGYVFATAGVTAFGRAFFPLPFAASSRYLTPALIMWAALLILLLAHSRHRARWSGVALAVVAALLVPVQMDAFEVDSVAYTPQVKAVAALSLQLDIDDVDAKRKLNFFYDASIEDIFLRARKNKVAIFSEENAYPANQIGRRLDTAAGEPCSGQLTFQKMVDKKRAVYKVGGTLSRGSVGMFRYVLFGDGQGSVNGIAIPGRDMDGPSGPAEPSNFDGYIFGRPTFSDMRCVR